jgi:outer membrane protein assembly factor BamB
VNGSSPETGLPVQFSKTESIKWRSELPGFSGATPAIFDKHVFVTSPDANKSLLAFAFDRLTGKELWRRELAVGDISKGKNNMASPSPVTDGKLVYFMFGTGDIAALDFEGKTLWKRNLATDYGRFAVMWIYGSSPLLHEGRLYIQVLQRDTAADYAHALGGAPERSSYLLALDGATGKTIWKVDRPSEAKKETLESYATPVIATHNGQTQLVIFGGECLTGHDLTTGAEVWRAGGFNSKRGTGGGDWMRVVPSPVVLDGVTIACGPKKDPVQAFKLGGTGDVTASHKAWQITDATPDVCTPAVWKGDLLVLDGDRQNLVRLDPKTGARKWVGNLGVRETFRASPTAADGKLYAMSEKGTVVVVDLESPDFRILATNTIGDSEGTRSSVAVAGGNLFIRTTEALYCVGK